jgi:predicted nucleic acid-binding protein
VIGGKVLDASALAALARRRVSALVWFDIAPTLGLTLYLPSLALAEVRAVRPDAAPLLADLLTHPSVVVGELDAAAARQVDQLLLDADVFDACAGHCVHVARSRGWPVLTADPGRLRRVDPDVQLDLL